MGEESSNYVMADVNLSGVATQPPGFFSGRVRSMMPNPSRCRAQYKTCSQIVVLNSPPTARAT